MVIEVKQKEIFVQEQHVYQSKNCLIYPCQLFSILCFIIHCLEQSRDDLSTATSLPPKLCNTLLLRVSQRDNDRANVI